MIEGLKQFFEFGRVLVDPENGFQAAAKHLQIGLRQQPNRDNSIIIHNIHVTRMSGRAISPLTEKARNGAAGS
ncbi:MAG: hypothetical protein ABIT16_06450 [Croceibacterium sp.]